jgi:glycerol-3-phosphate dehydrogenase
VGAITLRRDDVLREIGTSKLWDVLVIGGGATGLGAALEAASRGYRTLLIEKYDFAKGTSSRSTKLVHGGVRYLEQLNLTLVFDALRERGYMLKNAPHLVHRLPFVVPIYSYSGLPYYGFGLKVYEWLSGKLSFGRSQILSKEETIERLPTIAQKDLKGGILYFDGQFNDARYAIALMRTLEDQGGYAVNYFAATNLLHRGGRVEGVRARDEESGAEVDIHAKVVINATGVFTEEILSMDSAAQSSVLAVSQGTHFVLPQSFLPGSNAMMIPKTTDGRVLFAIPWQNYVVVGTTDEPVDKTSLEPRAMEDERAFLAKNIRSFLGCELQSADVLSMWSGLRPLIRHGGRGTAKLSRDHKIITSNTGLVSVLGGKWTTYRRMGEDAVNHAMKVGGLAVIPSRTKDLQLHGWMDESALAKTKDPELGYGSDLIALRSLQKPAVNLDALLHPSLPYRLSEVVWAARHEMARTVEDVLVRRTRTLFLNARVAAEIAPTVARLLADELDRDEMWIQQQTLSFVELAKGYIYHG